MGKKKQDQDGAYFWIAQGVVQIGSKEYGAEDVLPPVDEIGKKKFDQWVKDGKIGQKITAAKPANDEKIKELNLSVSELTIENGELKERVDELEAENGELKDQVKALSPDTGD